MKNYKYYVGGQWKKSKQILTIKNPYNNEIVFKTFIPTEDDLETAISKAQSAFAETRKLPSYKRAEILLSVNQQLKERKEEVARSITLQSGKPIKDAYFEVERSRNVFNIAAEEAKRINGEYFPLDFMPNSVNRFAIYRRFPLGIIFGISPFNFPLNLISHKVAPAIASGNTIIIKPASSVPITALILADIIDKTNLPKGAFSVLPLPGSAVEKAITDERIKKITFTGSPKVGWQLKAKCGKKKITLELGGNAGVIVDENCNLDYAISRCVVGGFSFAGQVCISVQRIYIQQNIYEKFKKEFIARVKKLKIGNPLNEDTEMSSMINEEEASRVEEWVKEAKQNGAKILCGGKRDGSLFYPTVFEDATNNMKISCLEVFAPIVTLEPFKNFKDAVAKVNNSIYGLQAGVFTNNVENMFYAYDELEVGGVIINDIPTYRIDHMPYGGIKESGFGREGIKYAIEEMTEGKLLAVNRV